MRPISLLIGLLLMACARPAAQLPTTYTGRQLTVGTGGGFSGERTAHRLLDDGRLFRQQGITLPDSGYRYVGRLPKAVTQRLFGQLETECRIKETRLNDPGNASTFVRWYRHNQRGAKPEQYAVTWGGGRQAVPPAYPAFIDQFYEQLPDSLR